VDFPPKLVLLPLNALMVRFNFAEGLKSIAVVDTDAAGSMGMGRLGKDIL
jgi:hypothetical protein